VKQLNNGGATASVHLTKCRTVQALTAVITREDAPATQCVMQCTRNPFDAQRMGRPCDAHVAHITAQKVFLLA
jgi:hypothetical protein